MLIPLLMVTGCKGHEKNLYLPEAKNDKIYTTVGGDDANAQKKSEKVNLTVTVNGDKSPVEAALHEADDYSLYIPIKGYRYEKDFDDGNFVETWNYTLKDDIEIKITTYKDMNAATAQNGFLRDNDDYIFEDLMGYSLCGMELDGDTLWFNLHEADGNVYIVSWEYPKNTSKEIKSELSSIADSFEIKEAK